MRAGVFLILFFFNATWCRSQATEIIHDLRDQWKVSKGDHFQGYQGESVHTIHLFVTDQFKGGIISIKAPGEFAVFVNGQLLVRARLELNLHVDSVLSKWAGVPILSVFQKGNVKSIRTELIHRVSLENVNVVRASTHFTDFVILSALLLFGFFVMLFRSNTRLTIDYLNLAKVFSVQEREDAIVTGRIGSSVNILFFVFISLLWGLLLLIIFTNGPLVLQKISIHSTAGAFGWWLLVSLLVFVFLVVKLVLVWIMSSLFGFKGLVRFQFFNFIRSLYVASALMGLVLLSYFVMELKNPNFFYFVLASGCGFMMLSAFFFFLKLMTRTSSAVFHLFSYLCGSEIISLMILIKVLLN
jgi:Domain of unknown function (DUF4271)